MKALAAAVLYLASTSFLFCAQTSVSGIHPLREFDLQLVAAGDWNPIAVDWDSRGRMWIAVTRDNPLQQRPSFGDDSILIADRSGTRKFCAGLNRVGGFVFARDGIVAAQGSQIVLVRDTNGDDTADRREVIFSGFGTDRFPAVLGSLRCGLDGWIYAVLGGGAERCGNIRGKLWCGQVKGGIIRFKSDGSAMETVSAFRTESGALDFTWDNELFFSRAEGPHASHAGVAERYFPVPGLTNTSSSRKVEDHQAILPRQNGHQERFIQASPEIPFERIAGAMIYEGGAWPERYHGNYYVCDPVLRVIHEDVISRAESAYFEATRRLNGEFLTATAPSFQPHQTRVGPDGAMYVLVSRETTSPFTDSSRSPFSRSSEQANGAIWRIQHKQARHFAAPDLRSATAADLARALEHPNSWVRRTALRLLVERQSADEVPLLEQLAVSSRSAPARVSALWCLHRLDALTHRTWTNALEDIHLAIQRNAWLTFAESPRAVTPEVEKTFNRLYKDADERVKLAMLVAMSKGPLTRGTRETIAKLFPDLKDGWSKSIVLAIGQQTPMDFIKVAFASEKSENFRELVVPLVKQLGPGNVPDVVELTRKAEEKTEKLRVAVKEALAKHQR